MNTASTTQEIHHLDILEIEKRAREIRAEAIHSFFQSVKARFAGFGFSVNGHRA